MPDGFEQAKALHAAERWEEAAAAYEQVLQADPESLRAWNNLGTVFEAQGSPEQALVCYQRALALDATQAIVHFNLAHVLHGLERVPEAIGHYLKTLELNPQSMAAQFNLGVLLYEHRQWAEAEAAFRETIAIAPEADRAHHCLGELLFDQRRFDQALVFAERAAELAPEDAEYQFNRAKCLRALNRLDEACRAYERSLRLRPESKIARQHLAGVLLSLGRQQDAADIYRQQLAHDADDPIARHGLAALTREHVPPRASDGYVQQTFDAFAADFETVLRSLDYRAPQLLQAVVQQLGLPAGQPLDALDAGCGTGLCGEWLRTVARRLVGVDLSEGMLAQARARECYDELVGDELTRHLQEHPAAYDLIVAADTLNYFGVLEDVFASAAAALPPGCWLAFTLEQGSAADTDWSLQLHGRYCHSEDYLRRALEQHGFQLVRLDVATLRREGEQPVSGWVALAQPASRILSRGLRSQRPLPLALSGMALATGEFGFGFPKQNPRHEALLIPSPPAP